MLFFNALLFAAPEGGVAAEQMPNPILAYAPLFISMFLIMYFLVIRPQKKQQAERDAMINSLKKGDKIVTSGGIIGTVIGVKENQVVIKVGDEGIKLELLKTSVNYIMK